MADKDFVIKNGLVVGDAATINGVQIDPSGASSNQVLKFDGTKFAPAAEGNVSGTVHSTTIGDGSATSFTINHNLGTRNISVTARNASSPYEVIYLRWEASTTNSVLIDFSSPPSSNSVVITTYAAVTGTQITSYKETIGDGVNSTYSINHSLGTRDIVVSVRNADSPYESINARWEATTINTLTLDFSAPLSNNSVRVGVVAI